MLKYTLKKREKKGARKNNPFMGLFLHTLYSSVFLLPLVPLTLVFLAFISVFYYDF